MSLGLAAVALSPLGARVKSRTTGVKRGVKSSLGCLAVVSVLVPLASAEKYNPLTAKSI